MGTNDPISRSARQPQCATHMIRAANYGSCGRRGMFRSIVVGTDGSETAGEAVRQASELAKAVGAKIFLVSAYQPVGSQRLREERQEAPDDVQWSINEKEDVEDTLEKASDEVKDAGVDVEALSRQGDPADAILDVAE